VVRLFFLGIVVSATLAFAACGGGDDTPDATPTPERPGPEDVLSQWVAENRNVGFVPRCDEANRANDIGKLCATLVGERGTRRAFALGPTFSPPTALAILEETPDGWTVLSVTNNDPSAGGVPGIPWPLQVGDRVVVVGLGENDCLRIREQPSQSGATITCVPDGTVGTILGGPEEVDTFVWWEIATDAGRGWSAENWLRLESEIQRLFQQPTPTAGPND